MDVTARRLETRDIWAVAKILRACQPEVMAALDAARRGPDGTQLAFGAIDWEALGLPLVFSLLEQAPTSVRELLASLADIEPAELDALPPATTFDLIAQVAEGEDWAAFLAPLSKMLSIRALRSTSSSTATAGETTTLPRLQQPATSKRSRAAG